MNSKFPLILAFLCVPGGRASAQVNLLPQGNFENPGVKTGWAQGFDIPNNQEFRVISEKASTGCDRESGCRSSARLRACLRESHPADRVPDRLGPPESHEPENRQGRLAYGPRCHEFRRKLLWLPGEVPELKADSDWVTQSVELKVPERATRLNIQPALFYCTGVFEIADLTVTPHLIAPKPLADAALPAGVSLDWDKKPR